MNFDFEKQTVRISRQLVGNLKLKEKEFTVTDMLLLKGIQRLRTATGY